MIADEAALTIAARLASLYTKRDRRPLGLTRQRLDNVRFRRVLDFITEHLEDDLSIAKLADVACLSSFHFVRMFHDRVGVPPHHFVSSLRLERAKVMLRAGKLPLAQIAYACCFSSQSNFTRSFKRAVGLSPGAYRRGSEALFGD